jgi:tetratricopeptide (TPR) repeat protein
VIAVDEVARRLAAGESLADLTLARMPPARRRALTRCSLVNGFDEAMYEAVLRDPEGPSLAGLLRDRSIEPLPGVPGDYQVTEELREAAWSSWWSGDGPAADATGIPEELRSLAATIAKYCIDAGRSVEALRALVLANQEEAARWFERQFEERDGALDLPGCQDLLDALAEPDRATLIGQRLADLRNDREAHLGARSLWHGALLATGRYLRREPIEARLLALLKGEPTRALRVHASAGMGKSMTLQWFIANYCVPQRVPCALVDLDAVDPVNATRHPWLVVLEMAAQLNVQMERAPFGELLSSYSTYRSLLVPQGEDLLRFGAAAIGSAAASLDGEDIRSRFTAAVEESSPGTPVLIIVDTFEEAVLRPAGDPEALVEVLADLHDAAPQVRLVLSGRRAAQESWLTRLEARLPQSVIADLEIPGFEYEEACCYLTERRGMDGQDGLLPAIIARARVPETEPGAGPGRSSPWLLSLLADVFQHSPGIDRATVEQLDPELAWCIDRIIGRIQNDALQWLVRYGVVPRRLRRDLAEKVLLPRMAAGMLGSDDDRPEHDNRPPGSTPVFRTGLTLPVDAGAFRALWDDLLRYAATTSSWVRAAPGDPDTVVLHPSVIGPLRRLLAAQPVYRLLHEDAARYYQDLARLDPDRWATWTRETLYHRFQLDGARAGGAWRAALNQARAGRRLDRVAELAGEILGPEYVDEDGHVRELRPGVGVIDAQLQVEAHVERAWALARLARDAGRVGDHPDWSTVDISLHEARRIPEGDQAVRLPETAWRLARAALLVARGLAQAAMEVLGPATEDQQVSEEGCAALVIRAEALRDLGRPEEARAALLAARDMADQLGDDGLSARIARWLYEDAAARGRYDEALRWLRTTTGEPAPGQTRLAEAGLMLKMGLPAAAERLATIPAEQDELALSAERRAVALVTLGRPLAAFELCEQVLASAPDRLLPDRTSAFLALRGRAAGELLDVDGALDGFVIAKNTWFQLQDQERAAFWTAEAARLHLRVLGNLKEAEQYLDETARLPLETGGSSWTRCQLLRAELQGRLGDVDRAVGNCHEVLETLRSLRRRPELLVEASVHAVSVATWANDTDRFSNALLAAVRAVTPGSAALALLGGLELCRGRLKVAERLLEVVQAKPGEPPAGPEDAAWRTLQLAEVQRLAGRRRKAAENATHAVRVLAGRDPFAWWTWLQLMERIGPVTADEPVPPPPADEAAWPLLNAAHELLLASRRMAIDPPERTDARLDRAEALLSSSSTRLTRWHGLLQQTRSRVAAARGNRAEASRRAQMATAVYVELGDEHAPVVAEDTRRAGWPEVAVHAAYEPGRGIVVTADGRPVGGLSPVAPLPVALDHQRRTTARSPLLKHLAGTIREDRGIRGLVPEPAVERGVGEPVDLRLTMEPPLVAQLPWELARTSRGLLVADDRVRFAYRAPEEGRSRTVQARALQRALGRAGFPPGPIDGLDGPMTRRAVADLQHAAGLEADGIAGPRVWEALRRWSTEEPRIRRPRVLVLRRASDAELHIKRGRSVEGYEIEVLYARAGWQVDGIEDMTSEGVERYAAMARTWPVHLLHVSGTMEETGSVPYLDFGVTAGDGPSPAWEPAQTGVLAVTLLSRLAGQLATEAGPPLVVLDVVAPTTFSEALRQLLLRNDFAYQLMRLSEVETVLATGLATSSWSRTMSEHLAFGLISPGRMAAEVAHELQRTPDDDDVGLLSTAGTALFSSLPPDAMLPLGS